MTTRTFITRQRHDSDAVFREWGEELHDELQGVGLVQTADTGQIDWGTVTRASTNSDAGYEIWRFDDALQGEAPVYIKVMYGTGSNASSPRTRWQVGTGSDGAGTLTGVVSDIHTADASLAANRDDVLNSYLCHTDGFFGLNHKGANNNQGWYQCVVTIERTVDTEGAFTTEGVFIQLHARQSTAMSVQFLNFATATTRAKKTGVDDCGLSVVPQVDIASNIGGTDLQAFLCWMAKPAVVPSACTCVVYAGEIAQGGNFNATLVGAVERTYIGTALASNTGAGPATNTIWTSGHRLAMLWE